MRPRMITVNRQGKAIRVWVEPDHPRGKFCLSCGVKGALIEEDQYRLCEVLNQYHANALERTSAEPMEVTIGEDIYLLSKVNNPREVGKVWIDIDSDN